MQLTHSDVYWLTRLDGIVTSGVILTFLGGLALLITFAAILFEEKGHKACAIAAFVMVFGWCLALFVPSAKEAAAIYVIPAIANNESVRAIPDTAARLTDEWLKQKLDEITGEKSPKNKE